MRHFRITKYDPKFRDKNGRYMKNEWTSFSDIGKTIDGKKLSKFEYEKSEEAYIESAVKILRQAKIDQLKMVYLEDNNKNCSFNLGAKLTIHELKQSFQDVLREKYWAKFHGDLAYVHFGWDFYMYIGVNEKVDLEIAVDSLLFVENFVSPYLNWEEHK